MEINGISKKDNYAPQFQARFIPVGVKLNRERWNKIADIFERKTKAFPNEKLYMAQDPDGRSGSDVYENGKKVFSNKSLHYFFSTDKELALSGGCEWFDEGVIGKMLAAYTDSEIASKLVKIFKQCKKYNKHGEELEKLRSANLSRDKIIEKSTKLDEAYYEARKAFYEKDGVLRDAANYYDGLY